MRAILAAEREALAGTILTISDGHPVTRRAFYTHLAELLGAPPARFDEAEAGQGGASRRVRKWGGFEARFADYRDGLADAVATSNMRD